MGLLGMLAHFFVKLDSLNRETQGVIDWKKFLRIERFAIIISLIVVIASAMLSQEVKELKIAGMKLGLGQLAIGYFAQSIAIKINSIGNKKIKNLGK